MNTLTHVRSVQPIELEKNAGFDVSLLMMTVLLCICGAVFVLTSSAMHSWRLYAGDSQAIFWNHMTRLGIGLLVMIVLSMANYHLYERFARPLIVAVAALLVVVLSIPQPEGATAHRWISFSSFSFQPAELAKFALIAYLSTRFAEIRDDPFPRTQTKVYLGCLFVIGLIVGLILFEPNLSMAAMVVAIMTLMFFIGGVRLRSFLVPAAVTLIGFAVVAFQKSYMLKRLTSHWSAIQDPMHASYQVKQSLIGIGSGGWTGVGLGQSSQKHFFLPEPYNDFIFSIIGEELGFLGSIGLLLCFAFLISRCWRIAKRAPDAFGYFLAAGITFSLAISFAINIGVTLGLLPATGQPLPFVSYGGTSLIIALGAVGVLLNISRQSQAKHPYNYVR